MNFDDLLYEMDLDPVGVYTPEEMLGYIKAAYNEGYVQGQADAENKVLL